MYCSSYLIVAPDHRIELAFAGTFCQILSIFFESLKIFFGVRIGYPRTAAHVGNNLFEIVTCDAVRAQNASGVAFFFSRYRQQKMLSRKIFVLHSFGFFLSFLKDRVGPGTEILLAAADLWKFLDRCLDLADDALRIRTYLAENGTYNTLLLLKHRCEQMLRLNLLVLIFLGDTDRFLNGFLAADRESVESHIFIVNDKR